MCAIPTTRAMGISRMEKDKETEEQDKQKRVYL